MTKEERLIQYGVNLKQHEVNLKEDKIKWIERPWRRENWFSVSACVMLGVGIALAILNRYVFPEGINEQNARYLLSAMAQVIGTVFVLTIAVLQIVGSSSGVSASKLFSEWKFWFIALISFIGIISPMIILYVGILNVGTPIYLGWAAANLLLIAWFILRTAPLLAKPGRVLALKNEAREALEGKVPSVAAEHIVEAAKIACEAIEGRESLTAHDACTTIKYVATYKENKFPEIWEKAIESLLVVDKKARGREFGFTETVTIPYLHDIAAKSEYKEDRGWLKIKEYLFKCLHEDIEKERIDFGAKYEEGKRTALQSIRIFLSGARNNKERWVELGDKIIDVLVRALNEGYLKEDLCPVVGLTFNILVEGALVQGVFSKDVPGTEERIEKYYENLISKLEGISGAIEMDIIELMKDKENCVTNRRYSIIEYDQRAIKEKFDELMERLEKG